MGYFEDFDFSLRLRDAGFDQSITEDVFVYHQGSATFSKNSDIHALIKHNKRIMKKRHASIRFFHVRQSTLLLLKKQLSHFNNIQTTNLRTRIDLRRRSIQKDFPKSLLKRLIWRIITKKFL
jgi:GT2 family glycosyltransferase